jgi:hypothetical protein
LNIDFIDPFLTDRTCRFPAFSADNGPVNALEIDRANGADQWLKGDEADRCGRGTQIVDPADDVFVLDARAQPDIR